MECLKQFRGIIFGYEIYLFSYHTNLVHAATLSEYQRVMLWRLVIKDFGPNMHHISGVDNIVADTISKLSCIYIDKYNPSTRKARYRVNESFAIIRAENNEDCFLLNLLNVQREQQKELRNINSKLSTYISDRGSGYSRQALNEVKIIFYYSKIYVPQTLHRRVLYWCQLYIYHPGGSDLQKQFKKYVI